MLAFYFGKESLETATRSVTAIAKATSPDDKLQTTKITDKMIPKASLFYKSLPASSIVLAATIVDLEKSGKGSRIPILGPAGEPAYVVHRSIIDKYLSRRATEAAPPPLATLTLDDLLADPENTRVVTSFGTLKDSATLADAKRLIVADANCQDVFITQDGTKATPVLGWITNIIIEENARV